MDFDKNVLQKLKDVELEILKAFIDVCKKLDIKYYALGGTMLGAVRHGGFIPWDDDIDVGMLRDDYELFLQKGQKLLPEHLFLQTIYTDPEFIIPFAKIRDSRTTFIETSLKNRKINHGIYIDIFPIDYYPDDDRQGKRLFKKKKEFNVRFYREYTFSKENQLPPLKKLIKKSISTALMIKYPNANKAIKKEDELFKSVPKSKRLTNYCGVWAKREIVPVEWYGDGCNGVFEGIDITLPTQYDKLLTRIYGNYMEFPPVEDRVAHHYTEVIDPYNPYLKYIK